MNQAIYVCLIGLLAATPPVWTQQRTVTELSKKAAKLKTGMSKDETKLLLGPPTWAVLPTDKGEWKLHPAQRLELMWRNGNCNPVVVSFDAKMRVDGWSEGRSVCGEKPYAFAPGDELLCKRPGRGTACR